MYTLHCTRVDSAVGYVVQISKALQWRKTSSTMSIFVLQSVVTNRSISIDVVELPPCLPNALIDIDPCNELATDFRQCRQQSSCSCSYSDLGFIWSRIKRFFCHQSKPCCAAAVVLHWLASSGQSSRRNGVYPYTVLALSNLSSPESTHNKNLCYTYRLC